MPGLIEGKALGLIETVGLVGAIEACDAAAKAADVVISAAEVTDAALVTLKIFGELGAVQAAVESGSAAAARVGQLLVSHVIPNPDHNLDKIMGEALVPRLSPKGPPSRKPRTTISKIKGRNGSAVRRDNRSRPGKNGTSIDFHEIERMRVAQLRTFARSISGLSIKGRQISRADKETLLREIRDAIMGRTGL